MEFFKQDADCDLSDYGEEKTYQADDEPEPELYESASQEDGEYATMDYYFVCELFVHCSNAICMFMFCCRR